MASFYYIFNLALPNQPRQPGDAVAMKMYQFIPACRTTGHQLPSLKDRPVRDWKILRIKQELFNLLEEWRSIISDEGHILRSTNRHGHFKNNLLPSSVSIILKAL